MQLLEYKDDFGNVNKYLNIDIDKLYGISFKTDEIKLISNLIDKTKNLDENFIDIYIKEILQVKYSRNRKFKRCCYCKFL